jgi:hypothetical protein
MVSAGFSKSATCRSRPLAAMVGAGFSKSATCRSRPLGQALIGSAAGVQVRRAEVAPSSKHFVSQSGAVQGCAVKPYVDVSVGWECSRSGCTTCSCRSRPLEQALLVPVRRGYSMCSFSELVANGAAMEAIHLQHTH